MLSFGSRCGGALLFGPRLAGRAIPDRPLLVPRSGPASPAGFGAGPHRNRHSADGPRWLHHVSDFVGKIDTLMELEPLEICRTVDAFTPNCSAILRTPGLPAARRAS